MTAGLPAQAGQRPRRVLVLGANGPTGRLTVQQALDRGLAVLALTRHPGSFPLTHERLQVTGGDATDPATVDAAVASCDAVISVIGTAFTWRPVDVYSATARGVVAAMQRHGQRRLLAVTSAGVEPADAHGAGIALRLVFSLFRRTISRTVYDDMEQMEAVVSASGLAAMLLDQLDDDRFVQRIAAVATPGLRVSAVQTVRRELLKR